MRYFTCSLALFFTLAVACFGGPDKATMEAKENAAWQAFKDKSADAFKKVVDKDVRTVYSDGIYNLQKELDSLAKADVKSFAITNFDMFTDEPDVVVTTYTVKVDGKVGDQDMTGTYNAGTVWKKEGDNWLAIFHAHSKQESTAPDSAHKNE
jgi:hypothetical protein